MGLRAKYRIWMGGDGFGVVNCVRHLLSGQLPPT